MSIYNTFLLYGVNEVEKSTSILSGFYITYIPSLIIWIYIEYIITFYNIKKKGGIIM